MATTGQNGAATTGAPPTVAERAADFLRFYLQGGAEAVRAGTNLISAPAPVLQAALAKFDANPATGPVTTIENDPIDAFVCTPGIARRIPAIVATAPDFIALANPDLDRASFTRPSDAPLGDQEGTTGLQGPVPIEDPSRPISPDDTYLDMCAMEDAVVAEIDPTTIEVSFIWVQDYPGEVLESASVPDASQLDPSALPRMRPVVDAAQPSVIVTECMEALQAFLGSDVFEQFTFQARLEICPFEALEDTRAALLQPPG
jgi:hypothetical protein